MVNKFQNRLVGTIILVALGVIILPVLLDGKKEHYQDKFASIPLVPNSGDSDDLDATLLLDVASGSRQLATLAPPEMNTTLPAAVKPEHKPVARPESKPVPKPQAPKIKATKVPVPKPEDGPAVKQALKRQLWVVQLGALKHTDNVWEIVAKLRLSGYRVYISPSAPVKGQITRIFVGPDASKEKLRSALSELNQLSGLNGQLRPYSIR